MSQSILAQKPAAEKEVFARTTPQLGNESCDRCGTETSPARYIAEKGEQKLFFCAHHTRKYADGLNTAGFTISPPDFSFEAAISK